MIFFILQCACVAVMIFAERKRRKFAEQIRQCTFDIGVQCGYVASQLNPKLQGEDLIAAARWVDYCLKNNNRRGLQKIHDMEATDGNN